MFNFKGLKKPVTFILCSAVAVSLFSNYSFEKTKDQPVSAKTIAEIQEERKQNEQKIADLENQLNSIADDKTEEQAYQNTLSEKIDLLQENILLLDTELAQIGTDITDTQIKIDDLSNDIAAQQVEVDNNIELFKERLCAMYITGNDSLALAVLGSTDFYDMLSRVEMVNSIAAHDEELVNTLKDEITTLETSKSNLETERLSLEMKKEEQEIKKQEKEDQMEELSDAMQKSQDEIDRLNYEAQMVNKSKEDLEANNAILDAQEAEIQRQIKAAAEEAERKDKEEADRKAKEEAAKNNNSGSSGTSGTTSKTPQYVDTSAGASGFAWPVPGYYYVSSGYGTRWGRLHAGIDISGGGISGASVCASKAGTVVAVSSSCTHNYRKSSSCCGNGYGNYVIISHDGTYSTLYGHLGSVNVSVGDYVSQGQVVGTVGCTGFSTGFHLHFEVRVNGSAQDPRKYV